ncbi:MAG: hypothetical protein PVH77_05045 [Phycisphaerales bacterium]
MSKQSDENPLKDLRAEMFKKGTFQAMDALVVFIPKGQKPSEEVQRVLDEAGPRRYYMKDGGSVIKCPYVVESFDNKLFKIEKGGWGHEHCDTCNNIISVGDSYWISEGDEVYLVCENCYQEIKKRA